jgi:integrase
VLIDFLVRPEIEALLAAPNQTTWLGRRDHAFLLTALQTGLRLSELTGLRREDVSLDVGAHVHCEGKGRKERCTPLTKSTVRGLTPMDHRSPEKRRVYLPKHAWRPTQRRCCPRHDLSKAASAFIDRAIIS